MGFIVYGYLNYIKCFKWFFFNIYYLFIFFTNVKIVININYVFGYFSNYICFWQAYLFFIAIFSSKSVMFSLSSCHLCTAPSLPPVPRWVAKEAGQARRSCRAGGARAAGPAGQSSRASRFVVREGGPGGQKIQLTSLVLTCFPHLSQSQRILVLTLLSILISNWVLVPPPLT